MFFLLFTLIAILVLPAFLLIYFIPSFVAKYRNHHNLPAIFILNLFFGWSFLGWGLALVWAVTRTAPYYRAPHVVYTQY